MAIGLIKSNNNELQLTQMEVNEKPKLRILIPKTGVRFPVGVPAVKVAQPQVLRGI
jgi:hypothetical protein